MPEPRPRHRCVERPAGDEHQSFGPVVEKGCDIALVGDEGLALDVVVSRRNRWLEVDCVTQPESLQRLEVRVVPPDLVRWFRRAARDRML